MENLSLSDEFLIAEIKEYVLKSSAKQHKTNGNKIVTTKMQFEGLETTFFQNLTNGPKLV